MLIDEIIKIGNMKSENMNDYVWPYDCKRHYGWAWNETWPVTEERIINRVYEKDEINFKDFVFEVFGNTKFFLLHANLICYYALRYLGVTEDNKAEKEEENEFWRKFIVYFLLTSGFVKDYIDAVRQYDEDVYEDCNEDISYLPIVDSLENFFTGADDVQGSPFWKIGCVGNTALPVYTLYKNLETMDGLIDKMSDILLEDYKKYGLEINDRLRRPQDIINEYYDIRRIENGFKGVVFESSRFV